MITQKHIVIDMEPLSTLDVDDLRGQSRIEHSDHDAILRRYLDDATAYSEKYLKADIRARENRIELTQFLDRFCFPVRPIDPEKYCDFVRELSW